MLLNIVLLVVGFVLLIKGADIFVEGASKIAELFHIPEIVIGLTIVSIGTSAPEAAVSITSAFRGNVGITVGNIVGSNIANVLLILGVSGMIGALVVKKTTYKYEIPFVMIITALLTGLGMFGNGLSKLDGVIFVLFFLVFLFYLYKLAMHDNEEIEEIPSLNENDRLWKMILMVLVGLVAIVIGSQLAVQGASEIAVAFGVSDRIIGLTIVAIGTSLPELMTSVTASMKGKNDIAVGNIIGSNIFNILFVLGLASIASPIVIPFSTAFTIDTLIALGSVVLFMLFIGKDMKLKKMGACVMALSYVAYLIYLIL